MKKYFEIGFGLFLIIIGLIGGLIPVLQGWMFGIPGLIILSKHSSFAKKILIWGQKKSGFKK
tara:strand:+ start:3110 stop:3295 length:186 start_codon:yes stop_codon:yes gene_type:complete